MHPQASGLWPVFGRDDAVAAVASWFNRPDSGGVILTGDAGVGKSALAASIATTLPCHRIVRVAANPALTCVPYGAIAHEVPADGVGLSGQVDRAALLRVFGGGEARTLVVADDPDDLDEGTLGLLAQLVTSRVAFIVATLRSESAVPPALVAFERSGAIRRLQVEPLDATATAALLASVLDGPVAPGTVEALWSASAGNPMYLRELVEHATSNGNLVVDKNGQWRLAGELGSGRRLSDVIADRIGKLPDDTRDLAKLIALAAPIRWSSLERGGYGDATLELERAGVVAVHDADDPTIDLAHPLHGEILRADIRVLERRRLLGRLIDWLDVSDATFDEQLRVADWQLALGLRPSPSILEAGARRAWSARDHAGVERFATAALEQHRSLATACLLVDALIHTGRSDEADTIADSYLADDDGATPRDRSRLVGLRVFNDLWYRERPNDAAAVVMAEQRIHHDPVSADELLIQEAYVALAQLDAKAVLELVEHRDWTAAVAPQGLLLTAQMMADTGRVADGLDAIDAAAKASGVATALTVSTPGSIDAASVRLTILSGDLDGADHLIAALGARPEYRIDPFIRGYLLLSAGRVALLRGRPLTARQHFADGRAVGEQHTNRVALMGCTAGLAVVASYLNDEAECRTLFEQLESFAMARVVRPSIAAGMAWALAGLGEPGRARDLLLAEAEHARGRAELVDAVMLACDVARLGDPAAARPLLDELGAQVDGLGALLCEAGLAMAGSTPDGLARAERRAAGVGMCLLAAELAASAARVHRRRGDGRSAAAAQLRSSDHLAGCEGAATPASLAIDGVSPLSNREREIAGLAASGLTNQEIADRLFVSVRTVGNHLQNSYTKLGVTGRSGLADALRG